MRGEDVTRIIAELVAGGVLRRKGIALFFSSKFADEIKRFIEEEPVLIAAAINQDHALTRILTNAYINYHLPIIPNGIQVEEHVVVLRALYEYRAAREAKTL